MTAQATPAAEPHPLNRDFRWTRHEPPFTTVTKEQAESYDEVGYFAFEDAFDADRLAAICAEIDPAEAGMEDWLRRQEGGRFLIARAGEITFTTHLAARSALLAELVSSPPLIGLCADLIGPNVRLYWDQAVYKKPDASDSFPWHQDNGYAYLDPQQYLTCWIALTDATVENGCPWVIPGGHLAGTLAHRPTSTGLVCFEDASNPVPVPVSAGSIVVFSSLTPHCTGQNRTDSVRKAYIVQYAPDGAAVLAANPLRDGGYERVPANAADRQFPVLIDSRPVSR